MTFWTFRRLVAERGWTRDQLHLEAEPDDPLIRLIDEIGLDKLRRLTHLLEATSTPPKE
jgi:hypothetical protein